MTAKAGRALRDAVPRSAHAAWKAPPRDPVATLRRMSGSWLPELVEGRWQRMAASPFAFLRGSARVMAADLSTTPVTGIRVQAAGDAHLLNFGGFGSPERRLLFDVEDFDETLPGAWEWDLKRLATSVVLAARELGHEADATAIGAAYRDAMAHYATLSAVAVWAAEVKAEGLKALGDNPRQWAHRTSRWELPRLTAGDRIVADPPRTEPPPESVVRELRALPAAYAATLAEDRVALLARYTVVDVARHAVGVGSYGTRCYVIYLRGREG
ncbi:MAG: hypothetical protein QOF76_578, partial [Solirubrobacteraceae bacterium]|nr:hypothetical protein [Solirubrobacteraceae bacterium]